MDIKVQIFFSFSLFGHKSYTGYFISCYSLYTDYHENFDCLLCIVRLYDWSHHTDIS